jgi:hypothetical protein
MAAMKNGKMREKFLNIVTYSSDSAPYSLGAGKNMMTPNKEAINAGVTYQGLGLQDEKYLAPLYWWLPSVYVPDADHLLRLFNSGLKKDTRDLTLYQSKDEKICATVRHLEELQSKCEDGEMDLNMSDLILVKYQDQNTSAAKKVFKENISAFLDEYVDHSCGTSLYILMVCHLMKPYISLELRSYKDVMQSVTTGIHILRLWN